MRIDLDGRLSAETVPGGTSRSYNFTDGRMASYSETIAGATRATSFAYDSADRIVSETTAGATTAYDYDNAGQLIEAVRGSDVTSYGYDQVGNRSSKTQGSLSTAYSYDAAQQLTSAVRSVSGVPTQQAAFTHDGAGRLTLAESLGSSFAIGYDATYARRVRLHIVFGAGLSCQVATYSPSGIPNFWDREASTDHQAALRIDFVR